MEMTFWDHLDALRGTLLRIAAVLTILTIGWFFVMPWFFDNVILAPCSGDFVLYRLFSLISPSGNSDLMPDFMTGDYQVHLINIELASQFFIHISSSFWLALVTGFPIVIYLLWRFVAPGLYEREKRGVRTAFLVGNLMFYTGCAVGYFLVFPLTLRFLAQYQISEMVPNQISLDSYMDNFITLIFIMGMVFELPLLAWLLGKMGLLTRDIFNRYRRYAIVIILIAAALITPTGDPFTLLIVFLPIYVLWEIGAILVPPTAPNSTT